MFTVTTTDHRQVFETPGSRQVANLLVSEGLKVAAAEGVIIPKEEADHILKKVRVIFYKPLKKRPWHFR